jgi:hypothetical protein
MRFEWEALIDLSYTVRYLAIESLMYDILDMRLAFLVPGGKVLNLLYH